MDTTKCTKQKKNSIIEIGNEAENALQPGGPKKSSWTGLDVNCVEQRNYEGVVGNFCPKKGLNRLGKGREGLQCF